MADILVIDDQLEDFQSALRHALKGHTLHLATNGPAGLTILDDRPEIRLVLLDIRMEPPHFSEIEDREGLEVLKRIKENHPDVPVIMLTVLREVDTVVEAMQLGAFHYITKPLDRDKLRDAVNRALETEQLKEQIRRQKRAKSAVLHAYSGKARARKKFHGMLGGHPLMLDLYEAIERVAAFDDVNILILGETGSGKDLAARAIHEWSPRKDESFVAVNCAALAENVLEAELFGHKKGAFTGAEENRKGLFVEANGGTLFLDEIGEMSPALQSKVLRAIENMEVRPVGGELTKVDVRIVCATNRDLLAESGEEGGFREDLYYRIADVPLRLPPLRDRKDDIALLAQHFLDDCARKNGFACVMDAGAIRALTEHDWPGNVRELASVIRRLVVFAPNGRITAHQARKVLNLPPGEERPEDSEPIEAAPVVELPLDDEPEAETEAASAAAAVPAATRIEELPEIHDLAEYRRVHGEIKLKEVLEQAIREAGNARGAMTLLGMSENRYDVFRKWLQRLGVSVRDIKETSGTM